MIGEAERLLHINTEADAWHALGLVLQTGSDEDCPVLDFSKSDWARIRITVKGAEFDNSLTSTFMRGLIDLQGAFYRSVALSIKGKSDARLLTDSERDAFELVFTLSPGSTELEAPAKESLTVLAREAAKKMTGRQLTLCILSIAVMYFGGTAWESYLKHESEGKDKTEMVNLVHEQIRANASNLKTLTDLVKAEPKTGVILDDSTAGLDSVVRHSHQADSLSIQGITLNRNHIAEITRSSRRPVADITLTGEFEILLVEPNENKPFAVKVQRVGSDQVFWAQLYDALASQRDRNVIKKAEWSSRRVKLTIIGRQVGDQILDARITKASTIRAQPMLVRQQVIRL